MGIKMPIRLEVCRGACGFLYLRVCRISKAVMTVVTLCDGNVTNRHDVTDLGQKNWKKSSLPYVHVAALWPRVKGLSGGYYYEGMRFCKGRGGGAFLTLYNLQIYLGINHCMSLQKKERGGRWTDGTKGARRVDGAEGDNSGSCVRRHAHLDCVTIA